MRLWDRRCIALHGIAHHHGSRRDEAVKCHRCQHDDSRVLDSRPTEEHKAIRRRRECLACFFRFTTYERLENVPLIVIKKDGTREEFDRGKVLKGMVTACEKRPVPLERLQSAVSDIEKDLRGRPE